MDQSGAESNFYGTFFDSSVDNSNLNDEFLTDLYNYAAMDSTVGSHSIHMPSEPHTPVEQVAGSNYNSPVSATTDTNLPASSAFSPQIHSPETPITPGSFGEHSVLNSPYSSFRTTRAGHPFQHRRHSSLREEFCPDSELDLETKEEDSHDGNAFTLISTSRGSIGDGHQQNALSRIGNTAPFQNGAQDAHVPMDYSGQVYEIGNSAPYHIQVPPQRVGSHRWTLSRGPYGLTQQSQSRDSYFPLLSNTHPYIQPTLSERSTAAAPPLHALCDYRHPSYPNPDLEPCSDMARSRLSTDKIPQKASAMPGRTHVALQSALRTPDSLSSSPPTVLPAIDDDDRLVQKIVQAMLNMSCTEDNAGVLKTWDGFIRTKRDRIESVCREMLALAKKRQDTGVPLCETRHMSTIYASFERRIDALCETLRAQKTVCKHLMEDRYIDRVIEDPSKATKLVKNNRRVNAQKKEAIDRGRSQTGVRGRGKGKRLGPTFADSEGRNESHNNRPVNHSPRPSKTRPKRGATRRNYAEAGEEDFEDEESSTAAPPAKKQKKKSTVQDSSNPSSSRSSSQGYQQPAEPEEHSMHLPGISHISANVMPDFNYGHPLHQQNAHTYQGGDIQALGPMRPMTQPPQPAYFGPYHNSHNFHAYAPTAPPGTAFGLGIDTLNHGAGQSARYSY